MIDERLMQPGSWDLRLKRETPQFLRNRINAFGPELIVITPTRLPESAVTYDSLLSASIYTGVILRNRIVGPNDEPTLSGTNLLYYLGDTSRSPGLPRAAFTGVTTLPLVLAYLFFNDTRSNGLHYSDVGVPTTAISFSWDTKETTWSIIERWRKATNPETQFRMRHDGTILFAAANDPDLFVQTPDVIITTSKLDGTDNTYRIAQADTVEWDFDYLAQATTVIFETSGGSTSNFTSGGAISFRSGGSPFAANLYQVVQSVEGTAPSYWATEPYAPRYEMTVRGVNGLQIGVDANVGDVIYVHDPWTQAVWPTSAYSPVNLAGTQQLMWGSQVQSARWPILPDMGVYWLYPYGSTGLAWTMFPAESNFGFRDISDFVVREHGPTELTLGAPPLRVATPPLTKVREV